MFQIHMGKKHKKLCYFKPLRQLWRVKYIFFSKVNWGVFYHVDQFFMFSNDDDNNSEDIDRRLGCKTTKTDLPSGGSSNHNLCLGWGVLIPRAWRCFWISKVFFCRTVCFALFKKWKLKIDLRIMAEWSTNMCWWVDRYDVVVVVSARICVSVGLRIVHA